MTDLSLKAKDVVDLVEQLQEASDSARSWTQATSCGRAPLEMPCRHPECVKWAALCSYDFARKAAHLANRLAALLTSVEPAKELQFLVCKRCGCRVDTGLCGYECDLDGTQASERRADDLEVHVYQFHRVDPSSETRTQEPPPVVDLMGALRKSLDSLKQKEAASRQSQEPEP